MSKQPPSSSPGSQLYGLIGAIYDCAINPDQWPRAIELIGSELRCVTGSLNLLDMRNSRNLLLKSWNLEPEINAKYESDIVFFHSQLLTQPIDEPCSGARLTSLETSMSTKLTQEWSGPRGYCDALHTIVYREPSRIGIMSLLRHISVGYLTDGDIATMRLLAPHIRRAVTISDLIDLKILQVEALSSTLDSLTSGVIVVANDLGILHANDAAGRMFTTAMPIRSENGKLVIADSDAHEELLRAIKLAQADESRIGTTGIGVAMGDYQGHPTVAHVLPLATGDIRTRLMPRAAAAVFVTPADCPPPTDIDAIAKSFKLTPAETRLMSLVATGKTLAQSAQALAMSQATAKTHLARIFSKTGVSRQAELVALVNRLVPPIRRNS